MLYSWVLYSTWYDDVLLCYAKVIQVSSAHLPGGNVKEKVKIIAVPVGMAAGGPVAVG